MTRTTADCEHNYDWSQKRVHTVARNESMRSAMGSKLVLVLCGGESLESKE